MSDAQRKAQTGLCDTALRIVKYAYLDFESATMFDYSYLSDMKTEVTKKIIAAMESYGSEQRKLGREEAIGQLALAEPTMETIVSGYLERAAKRIRALKEGAKP